MSRWSATGALRRACVVGFLGLAGAVVTGQPALLVVTAPVLLTAVPALARRPRGAPQLWTTIDHPSSVEGSGTTVVLHTTDDADVEQVTRVVAPEPHVRVRPAAGCLAGLAGAGPEIVVSPQRWGTPTLGAERVALTSAWSGFRWGPVALPGRVVRVLPATAYRSRAESPHPRGLVGAHRSARPGAGTELDGIRVFQPGDRLRRISWRVSARTGALHVTTARAEQDAGLLLVIDLFAEHGTARGLHGSATSLDVTVRAAAALADHAVRTGDRVALRPIGGRARAVPSGAGRRHLRRLLGSLVEVRTGSSDHDEVRRLDLRAGAGTTVVVLSPLLVEAVATTAADLVRRGLPTVVIDTLPPDARPDPGDADPVLVDLAWRMRRLEREQVLSALASIGCPVVAWHGPGTADEVLRRLARRHHRPGVRS